MLQPESITSRPRGVPFPVNVRYHDYWDELLVETDDDSGLTRQFCYLSRYPQLRTMAATFGLLCVAATIGDLEFLEQMQLRFGGVLYSSKCALAALANRHFDFYFKFVQLSRSCCIVKSLHPESPFWASARHHPFIDVLAASLCQELRFKIFHYVFEVFILSSPPHEYLKRFLLFTTPDVDAIEKECELVSSDPDYPNLSLRQACIILEHSLLDITRSHLIRKFLIEEQGYYFSPKHLPIVTHYKRLYEFVLHNLEPGVNRDAAKYDEPYRLLNDFTLMFTVFDNFHPDRISTQDDIESELRNMAELWYDQQNLIPKIVYLINVLESGDICHGQQLDRLSQALQRHARAHQTDVGVYGQQLGAFLRRVLNMMSALEYDGFANIDWNFQLPIDFKGLW